MAIVLSNGVNNGKGTPAIISDTTINQPNANMVAIGTIYIDQTTNNIYQSDGNAWVQIGGGGGTPTLDQVLTAGNISNGQNLQIDDNGSGGSYTCVYNSVGLSSAWNVAYGQFVDTINQILTAYKLGFTQYKYLLSGHSLFVQVNQTPLLTGDVYITIPCDNNNGGIVDLRNKICYTPDINLLLSSYTISSNNVGAYTIINGDNTAVNVIFLPSPLDCNPGDLFYFMCKSSTGNSEKAYFNTPVGGIYGIDHIQIDGLYILMTDGADWYTSF